MVCNYLGSWQANVGASVLARAGSGIDLGREGWFWKEGARAGCSRLQRQGVHYLFENSSPVLIVLELIETGTGRSQQHDVSSGGDRCRAPQRGLQGLGVINLNSPNLRLDFFRGGADGVDTLDPLLQQPVELR